MAGGGQQFRHRSAWDETTRSHVSVQVAKCCRCGREATIHDAKQNGLPVSVMADKFRRKGWRIGARRTADECPSCVGGLKLHLTRSAVAAKPALSPAQKRAAFCRIADVPRAAASKSKSQKPKEAVMPSPKPAVAPPAKGVALTIVADPPREPTREDKRKIREALDACYLTDKGVYTGDGSDAALAKRLDVPRAWVATERDDAYGPDACEDDGADLKMIPVLVARVTDLEAKAMAVAEEAEAARLALRKFEDRLAKRGVA